MKKILLSSKNILLILLILIGSLFLVNSAHAQTTPVTYNSSSALGPTNYNQNADMGYCTTLENTPSQIKTAAQQDFNQPNHGSCALNQGSVSGCTGSISLKNNNADGSVTTCTFSYTGNVTGDFINTPSFSNGAVDFPNNPSGGSVSITQSILQALQSVVTPNANLLNATPVSGTGGTGSATGATTQVATTDTGSTECSLTELSSWSSCVMGWVADIALMFVGFAGFILAFIGTIFNWIVVITIFQFGAYFGNSPGLLTAWGILRDIGNIVLICGFIFMGLLMVLDIQTTTARKSIPQFIIIAVLLNFSLFGAEAVVDVSDVLSAALYNQAGAAGASGSQCGTSSSFITCATNIGISGLVLNATGFNDIFKSTDNFKSGLQSVGSNPTHKLIVYIGLTIFMSVTAATLLAATILLIIRAVVLVFVLVLAPVGLVAMVIPPLAGQGKQWIDTLLKQSFFAPVYLLLILISLKIMLALQNTFNVSAGQNGASIITALSTGNTSNMVIFVFFALIIGFMIAAQMTAGRMGAMGASYATGVANKAVRSTVLAPAKIAGRVGAVGGQTGYRFVAGNGLNFVGKKYDTIAGKLRAQPGATGWIATRLDNAISPSIRSGIDKARDASLPGTKGFTDKQKADEARKHHVHEATKEAATKEAIKKGMANAATAQDKEKMRQALQNMSPKELAGLVKGYKSTEQGAIASMLGTDKFSKLLEQEGVDHHALMDGRYKEARDMVTALKAQQAAGQLLTTQDLANVKRLTDKYSQAEYEIIAQNEASLFDNIASLENSTDGSGLMKDDIAAKLKDSDKLSQDQKEAADNTRRLTKLNNLVQNGVIQPNSGARIRLLVEKMGNEIADANSQILLSADAAAVMQSNHVAAIVAKQKMSDAEAQTLRTNIIQNQPHNSASYQSIRNAAQRNAIVNSFFGGNLFP